MTHAVAWIQNERMRPFLKGLLSAGWVDERALS